MVVEGGREGSERLSESPTDLLEPIGGEASQHFGTAPKFKGELLRKARREEETVLGLPMEAEADEMGCGKRLRTVGSCCLVGTIRCFAALVTPCECELNGLKNMGLMLEKFLLQVTRCGGLWVRGVSGLEGGFCLLILSQKPINK